MAYLDLLLPAVAAGGVLSLATAVYFAAVLARAPVLGRMAVRNILRRKSRLPIVVGGLMIGTAIVASSLVVGDTLEHIFVDDVHVRLGAVDEWVGNPVSGVGGAVFSPIPESYFTTVRDALAADAAPVDGVAPAILQFMPVENLDGSAGSPNVLVAAYNDSHEAAFGPLLRLDGSEAPLAALGPLEAYVNERAVREFSAAEGHRLRLVYDSTKAAGGFATVTVRGVVRDWGKANWDRQPQIFMDLRGAQASLNYTGLINLVRVSNTGDVATGVVQSDAVLASLDRAIIRSQLRATAEDAKADQLRDAESFSADVTEVFLMMGSFSITSGILLIVNILTMLAEERKGELGIARAVGVRRAQLLAMFVLEGGIYALLAALVGTLAGLGLGYAIIYAFGVIFPPPEPGMVLQFHFDWDSLGTAFATGATVTYLTGVFASLHVARLNIVRAIRDLPEPAGRHAVHLALGGLLAVAGAAALAWGLASDSGPAKILGVPAVFLGAATAALYLRPSRRTAPAAFTAAGLGILWWILLPQTHGVDLVNEQADDAFVLLILVGLVLVLGAILSLLFLMPLGLKGFDALLTRRRGHPVLKTAVSYPMEKRFRTGMTLAMFALILFTVTMVSVVQGMQDANLSQILRDQTGGFDVIAYRSNYRAVPDFRARLANVSESYFEEGYNGTASASIVLANLMKEGEPRVYSDFAVFGVDNYLLEANTYGFYRHADAYRDENGTTVPLPDAESVWRALSRHAVEGGEPVYYALVDRSASGASQFTVGLSRLQVDVGERVRMWDSRGENVTVEILGILDQSVDFTRGLFTSLPVLEQSLNVTDARVVYFFQVAPGVDAQTVADALRREFFRDGLQTINLDASITEALDVSRQVLYLIQAYLAIGLLAGIAGLGIIMVRAVVERRQQIGALRAIGFTRRMITRAFLIEIAFVASLGTFIGVALGAWLSYNVYLTYFSSLATFVLPWGHLAAVVVAALAATLVFTASPAFRAARIPPAEALRYFE
jgi:putative ABC transport system permease protein